MLRNDPTANIHVLKAEDTAAMMMYLSGVICFLMILTVEAKHGNSSHSSHSSDMWFCQETKECLHFETICETEDYEVRHYDSALWVSTEVECYFMEFAAYKAFGRLRKYITGENEMGIPIEMTAPVITKVKPTSFFKPTMYTLSFLLPSEYQVNAPLPTDHNVYLQRTPPMYVYVKSYGGWATTLWDKINRYFLSRHLDDQHANYNKKFHYAACYNSPKTIMNRHNEVWMEAVDKPVCGEK